MKNRNKCLRCGHKWQTRIDSKVLSCPACKSYVWNVAVKVKIQKPAEKPRVFTEEEKASIKKMTGSLDKVFFGKKPKGAGNVNK